MKLKRVPAIARGLLALPHDPVVVPTRGRARRIGPPFH